MFSDTHAEYLHQQLAAIGLGLMNNQDQKTEKWPNDIVQYIKMDASGKWLVAGHLPGYWSKEFEQPFPLQLCFYRKGVDYFIKATGTAIVANKRKLKAALAAGRSVLPIFKLTPDIVEYTSNKKERAAGASIRKRIEAFFVKQFSRIPYNNGFLY